MELIMRDLPYHHRIQAERMSKQNYLDAWYELSKSFITTKWFPILNLFVIGVFHLLLGAWSIQPSFITVSLAFIISVTIHPFYLRQKIVKEILSYPDMHDNFYSYWCKHGDMRRFLEMYCEETGEIAGIIGVRKIRNDNSRAEFKHLCVHKKFRDYQLERRLVAAVEKIAFKWGCSRMFVETSVTNKRFRAMYKELGYSEMWSQSMFAVYPGYNIKSTHLSRPLYSKSDGKRMSL